MAVNSNSILASLGRVGKLVYDAMINRLDAGIYPRSNSDPRGFSSIQDATYVESPESDGNGRFHINIVTDLKKAPYAWAYEVGSGEHGKLRAKYPIEPKNATALVFPESDWPKFNPPAVPGKKMIGLFNGLFFLRKVDHPGIEARPYIQPTILTTKDDVKKILGTEFKAMLLQGIQRIEVIK